MKAAQKWDGTKTASRHFGIQLPQPSSECNLGPKVLMLYASCLPAPTTNVWVGAQLLPVSLLFLFQTLQWVNLHTGGFLNMTAVEPEHLSRVFCHNPLQPLQEASDAKQLACTFSFMCTSTMTSSSSNETDDILTTFFFSRADFLWREAQTRSYGFIKGSRVACHGPASPCVLLFPIYKTEVRIVLDLVLRVQK